MQTKRGDTCTKIFFNVFVFVLIWVFDLRVAYAHNTPCTWRQAEFWFRDDDGGEACDSVPSCTTGATGYSSPDTAQITSLTDFTAGDPFRLRISLVKNNPGDLETTTTPVLEFKIGGTCADISGWTPVPTATACGSTAICQALSANFADGAATTILLSALLDLGGDMVEGDGSADISESFGIGNGTDSAEWEWMLDTDNVAASTTYTFRLSKGATNTNYAVYTNCPTLTTAASASTTYTQNDFEWFVTADSATLTNAWPSGSGTDLAENAALTQIPVTNEPPQSGDKIRVQMNFGVSGASLSAATQNFKLQYDAAEDCTSASGWADVGAKASGTIWRLFDEASIGDSTAQVNNISTSTASAEGYYSEINPSGNNPNEVLSTPEYSEWDWPVENNGAAENTTYCFRMVLGDGTLLDTYNADSYPKLTTVPGMSSLMRHGRIFQNDTEQGFFWAN